MKRYLLFAGDNYYPGGGIEDFINSYDTPELAFNEIHENQNSKSRWDWWQLVDKETMKLIKYNE